MNYGPGANRIQALLRESDLLVSFGPVNRIPVELFRGRSSIFIDSDPIYLQLKLTKGDRNLGAILDAHKVHFTFGENIGKAGINLADCWLYVASNSPTCSNGHLGKC